jgi:predicted nucleic acid-binding protein
LPKVRTYIDSGVLIDALRGTAEIASTAQGFLNDPLREYVTSDYVKIELLPKCTYYKKDIEREFYEEFFKGATTLVPSSDDLLALAIEQGCKTGISGVDAIHVACALVAEVTELITSEKSDSLLHSINGVNGIKVISTRPD